MAVAADLDLQGYCLTTGRQAKQAAQRLGLVRGEIKNAWLRDSARRLRDAQASVLEANERDLDQAPHFGLSASQVDRLRLNPDRIETIARGLEEVASLADPVGETIEGSVRPNGLQITKVRVPLGVVFFIYESRPNVTADAAAICVKSGNAVILRGGKEAAHSSQAIVDILNRTAAQHGLPEHAIQLVATPERAAVGHFLRLADLIDVAIPRGGESLIRRVVAEATMPVIKHYTGNCHVFLDASADADMAERITVNAKCQRMGVCNACESLLVHADAASRLLPRIGQALQNRGIELRGDDATRHWLPQAQPATEEDYATEYLGPIISIRVVPSLEAAIEHINRYGSHHTDAIITQDLHAARTFTAGVDSSAVMVNASTRFNDGGEFGLGADRNQYRQVSCARSLWVAGIDQLQVRGLRERADPFVKALGGEVLSGWLGGTPHAVGRETWLTSREGSRFASAARTGRAFMTGAPALVRIKAWFDGE